MIRASVSRWLGTHAVTIAGVALIALAGGGWYLWSARGAAPQALVVHPKEFVQQVSVSGKVTPAHDVDLGFAGGGRVARAYVQIGQAVAAGQVLAEIENGDLRAAVAQRQAALAAQQAKLDALKAGPRPESIAVSQAALASAEATAAQARQSLVNALGSAYAKTDDAVHNKTDQFISNPRTQSLQLGFTTGDSQLASRFLSERAAMESRLEEWQASVRSLTPDSDLARAAREAQGTLAAASKLLADANALLNSAISTTGTTQSTIDGWITDVAAGRTAIESETAGVTSAQTSLSSAAAALVSAQKSLALASAGATREDLEAQQAQIRAAQADVDAAQAQLGKTLIVAPFSGIVTKMDAKAGSLASAGIPLISLESRGTFQIESYVPEIHISLVKPGQKARVTLEAYGETAFDAAVVSVDPAETVRDGVPSYRVVLQFLAPDARIRSGLTADVTIIAQIREGVLAVPQGLIMTKDGASYVNVLEGERIVERAVQTGAVSSLGEAEILSGLSDGERLAAPAR